MIDVRTWLNEHRFEDLVDLFEDNEIDGETLFELNNDDLKELGLSLGLRKKLLKAIAKASAADTQNTQATNVRASQTGERRQVTVLFADIAGYTQLSTQLDPEETYELLNAYFEAVDGIVEEYGGKVDKHIGDAVMAIFGAPVAHSDDPLRAVRAAVQIHEAMPKLAQRFGYELKAHIGIASGVVVASRTGSSHYAEYTVTGDTVNLASRLDGLAQPDETLVSEAVRRGLSRHAVFSSRGSTIIKGLPAPVQVWRFEHFLQSTEVTWTSAFVGRHSEKRQFSSLLEAVLNSSGGEALLIRGEPGIGKTRLVSEFSKLAQAHDVRIHTIHIVDFGANRGAKTLFDLAVSLLDLTATTAAKVRKDTVARMLAQSHVAPENEVFLHDLLDLELPENLRSAYDSLDASARQVGIRWTLTSLLENAVDDAPRMIIIEDIHWADRATLEALTTIAVALPDWPAILVFTSRVEGRTLDQKWLSSLRGCPLTTIELQPLRRKEALQLAAELSKAVEHDLEGLVQRADGNPLFLEQLVDGMSTSEPSDLPNTIQGLVLARTDRVESADREVLFAACVLGQRFTPDLLKEMVGEQPFSLERLADHRLLRTEGAECVFCHALLREGLYASLLTERRRDLHLRAASVYAEQDPVLHAQHLDRAGSARSANAYLAAAQSELDRFRHEPALRLAQRGLELTTGPEAFALNMLSGELNHRLGNTDDAIEAYRIAQQHASSHEEACRALVGIAESLRVKEDYNQLLLVLDEAEKLIEGRDLPHQQARLCQLRASVHFVHGETAQCLSENRRSLEFAREAGSSELEAQALGNLADAEFSHGRMASAHSLFDECVALSFKHNFSKVAAANISMRGQTLLYLGHPQKALADCEDALQLSSRQFNPRAELVARLVGTYTLELFDLKAGQEWAKAGAELAKKIGAGRFELVCTEYLGRLAALEGDGDLAEQLVGEAVTAYRASESSMRFLGGRALGSYALVCKDSNRRRELLLEGGEILKLGVGAHNPLWFYRDAIEVSLDLEDWAATERYADRLQSYASFEPLEWSRYFAARGRALAQHGAGRNAKEVLRAVRARGAEIGYTYSLNRLDATIA